MDKQKAQVGGVKSSLLVPICGRQIDKNKTLEYEVDPWNSQMPAMAFAWASGGARSFLTFTPDGR